MTIFFRSQYGEPDSMASRHQQYTLKKKKKMSQLCLNLHNSEHFHTEQCFLSHEALQRNKTR